jgi:ribose transport system ATP-binding protein
LLVDGSPVSFHHPADAIRAGLVYVAADRAEALLMQRSVRENIALPFSTRISRWGLIDLRGERRTVNAAVATLQIDARAGGEVRRLSGGNQQKVTIARWVAGGVHTMLCFDPTRGIDIRTKHQIYVLLRDLAEAGTAVLLYTSELKEVQLVCDRAIVIFGGSVVAEIGVADADEPTLLRAAYNLRSDVLTPEEVMAEAAVADASAAVAEAAVAHAVVVEASVAEAPAQTPPAEVPAEVSADPTAPRPAEPEGDR